MKTWRKLGLAGLAAGALAIGAQRVDAACIDPNTNTVSIAGDCLFATGGATDNCRLAISVLLAPPVDPKKIICIDGDPACDADGSVNGSCVFSVGACVNLPVGGCAADTVSGGVITKPGLKDVNNAFKTATGVYNNRNLQEALDALLPTGSTGACTSDSIPVKVDLKSKGGVCNLPEGENCVSDVDCDDYCMPTVKKNKVNVALTVTDSADDVSAKFKLTCVPDEDGVFSNGAEARVIGSNPEDAVDLIGGPLAMGKPGDYLIRNGNVRAIAKAPGREHSFTLLHGGQIIDADLVRNDPADDRDGWLGSQPLVNISSTQATISMAVENNGTNGRAAQVSSTGPDDLFDPIKGDILVTAANALLSVPTVAVDVDLPVQLTTNLYLTPYSNTVQVATTVENLGASQLTYFMGDFVNPGGQVEPFGPGQGYGETLLRNGGTGGSGGQTLDFLAFQGGLDSTGVTYGLIFPSTSDSVLTAQKTAAFASSGVYAWVTNTDLFGTLFAKPNLPSKGVGGFVVPVGGERTLRRWFVIGETVADVTKARTELFQQDKAALQGVVTTTGGAPAAGAHVTLINNKANYVNSCETPGTCVNVFTSTLTDDHGFYRFIAPPGVYEVAVRKSGSPYPLVGGFPSAVPTLTTVELSAKKTLLHDMELPGTGSVVVNAEDQATAPIAAKVSVVGVPASPDPLNVEWISTVQSFVGRYFGFNFEEKGDVFGLADARFTGIDGTTGSFDLEPGTYHVVVSKGYEYDVYDEVITVTAGATTTVDATVNRVVDTTGFVSIDTHVHMINSPDSTISRERRILSMIAEGVDFFANTDHDFVHQLSDDIDDMGATGLVANAPSVETTTSHYGHFNTWPLTVDTSRHDGGAIDWSSHPGELDGAGYPSNGAYDMTPAEIFTAGHAYDGEQVIQVNHFNSGTLGHFNSLGIDTEAVPPDTTNRVYRCVGGDYVGNPCQVKICSGGVNDGNLCTTPAVDCPGGTCPTVPDACTGGGTCTLTGQNLGSFLRINPAVANLYDDGYTALEIWIEAGRGQTATLLADNMGDWFNLMNQGSFKTGIADSDTHSSISVQAGGPRTFVASSAVSPASIDVAELAASVNDMRAIGSNGPFIRVELENGSAATASHALGDSRTVPFTAGPLANNINLHIEAPTWAEYDKIDVYLNATPSCKSAWTFMGAINPSSCSTVAPTVTLNKGVDFTVSTSVGVSGFGVRQVTDVSIPRTITGDTWVVVVVRGTDGVSRPLFPTQPQDLAEAGNATLSGLTDGGAGGPPWNLGEQGVLALAYSNPLFFDTGDGLCHGGTACPGL